MKNDNTAVEEAVKASIGENPGAAEDYLAGKEKSFGFLMGRVMKRLGRSANPELAKKALTEALRKNSLTERSYTNPQ